MAPRLRGAFHGIDSEELAKLDQRLKRNREIVESRLFDIATSDADEDDKGITKERVRQITKRAVKTIAELAGSDPKFQVMASYRKPGPSRTKPRPVRIDAKVAAQMCPPSAAIPDSPEQSRLARDVKSIELSAINWAGLPGARSTMRH